MSQTKQQLLDQLWSERAAWHALLEEIGMQRMELAGVAGDWSMKDTIAHLTTWWRREVARIAAAQRGDHPPEHPPQALVPVINQWVYLTNRDRPLEDVLRDAEAVWQQFITGIQALPEEALCNANYFVWMKGKPLGTTVFNDFVGHLHGEHEPLIRTWLAHESLNART